MGTFIDKTYRNDRTYKCRWVSHESYESMRYRKRSVRIYVGCMCGVCVCVCKIRATGITMWSSGPIYIPSRKRMSAVYPYGDRPNLWNIMSRVLNATGFTKLHEKINIRKDQ